MKLKEFLDKNEDLFDSDQMTDLIILTSMGSNIREIADKEIRESIIKLIKDKREILWNKEIVL